MNNELNIRFATEKDISLITDFIKELAKYEKLLEEVVVTKEILFENIFQKKYAEVLIAELNKKPIGFALFFHNFSTFLGKPGIYIEDIYIKESFRGKGYGKKIFSFIANLSLKRNCGRLEWAVLDWNKDAIKFYNSIGAKEMKEWKLFRITVADLQKLARSEL